MDGNINDVYALIWRLNTLYISVRSATYTVVVPVFIPKKLTVRTSRQHQWLARQHVHLQSVRETATLRIISYVYHGAHVIPYVSVQRIWCWAFFAISSQHSKASCQVRTSTSYLVWYKIYDNRRAEGMLNPVYARQKRRHACTGENGRKTRVSRACPECHWGYKTSHDLSWEVRVGAQNRKKKNTQKLTAHRHDVWRSEQMALRNAQKKAASASLYVRTKRTY